MSWRLSLRNNRWQVSNDVLTSLPDPSIYTLIPQSIRIDEIANDLPAALPIPPLVIPPTRVPMNTPGELPRLDSKLDYLNTARHHKNHGSI